MRPALVLALVLPATAWATDLPGPPPDRPDPAAPQLAPGAAAPASPTPVPAVTAPGVPAPGSQPAPPPVTESDDPLVRLAGSWIAEGVWRPRAGGEQGPVSCKLEGKGDATSLVLAGACEGGRERQPFLLTLRREGREAIVGTIAGDESGTRVRLQGRRDGDAILMQVAGATTAGSLRLSLPSPRRGAITLSRLAGAGSPLHDLDLLLTRP